MRTFICLKKILYIYIFIYILLYLFIYILILSNIFLLRFIVAEDYPEVEKAGYEIESFLYVPNKISIREVVFVV